MAIKFPLPKQLDLLKGLLVQKLLAAPIKSLALKAVRWLAAKYIEQSKDSDDVKDAVLIAWGVVNLAKRHYQTASDLLHLKDLDDFFRGAHEQLGEPSE